MEGCSMRREERVTLFLRALYERHGYKKYRMGRFEEYDLYLENKNFLKSRQIITFNDLDGRVLALKPDVTLSIVKNTHADASSSEKFYYLENVYRLDAASGQYREISQLGLEYLGIPDEFATGEVLALAMKTLRAISERARMQISHAGFAQSLLEGLSVEPEARQQLIECVRRKNAHELAEKARWLNIPPAAAGMLAKLCALSGEFRQTLQQAREIAITPSMTGALRALESAYDRLEQEGCAEGLTLDFSLVSDMDYYCGLIFQGYVPGVPRAVLAGGCYANLLRKFGRELDAIGFAVYLNELASLDLEQRGQDVDVLLLYGEKDAPGEVARAARALMDQGLRVRCERSIPREARYGRLARLEEVRFDA